MKTNPDDSAFPLSLTNEQDKEFIGNPNGLTIREYFAAMAMQGYLSNQFHSEKQESLLAEWSVQAADALIEQLNNTR